MESRHNHHRDAHPLTFCSACILLWEETGVPATPIHSNRTQVTSQGLIANTHTHTAYTLRGVSRSAGDECRQPADFNRVQSSSLSSRVLAHCPWGSVSAHIVGGCSRRACFFRPWETARATWIRLAGTMWPVDRASVVEEGETRAMQLTQQSTLLRVGASASE